MHVLSAGDGYTYYTEARSRPADAKRDRDRELGELLHTSTATLPDCGWVAAPTVLGVSGTVTEEQMKALYGEGAAPGRGPHHRRRPSPREHSAKEAQPARQARPLLLRLPCRTRHAAGTDPSRLRHVSSASTATSPTPRNAASSAPARALRRSETRRGREAGGQGGARQVHHRRHPPRPDRGRRVRTSCVPVEERSPSSGHSADTDTRKAIEAAQEQAVRDTIGYLEREADRDPAPAPNGVAQIEVEGGIAATVFRHYDSRNGDPQLHDHVVVANKVKGVDGKWRTIDSKLLHRNERAGVRVLQTPPSCPRSVDVSGSRRPRGSPSPGKRPVMEIAGVDPDLIDTFSSRSASIRATTARLTEEYQRDHGRAPDAKTLIAIAQQATLETRPQKDHVRSPQAIHEAAVARVGADRAAGLVDAARALAPTNKEAASVDVDEITAQVLRTVEEHHAVWGAHVIEAEARRHLAVMIPDQSVAEPLVQQVTRAALGASVTLTPRLRTGRSRRSRGRTGRASTTTRARPCSRRRGSSTPRTSSSPPPAPAPSPPSAATRSSARPRRTPARSTPGNGISRASSRPRTMSSWSASGPPAPARRPRCAWPRPRSRTAAAA
ncbi:MobF family relaxase [Clavibacter nebraskensis]|uniref:MobF family relaxase n=1 Tax=Clavibacter nebraskensis TaxID=31963 RepID=UPI00200EE643|nr:MobF family relaxase [Clavibacter nebraskensis]